MVHKRPPLTFSDPAISEDPVSATLRTMSNAAGRAAFSLS